MSELRRFAAPILALIGLSLPCATDDLHAQSGAEAQVIVEAIRFRLDSLDIEAARRIVLDTAATDAALPPETASQVAQLLGGTLGRLSDLMTCSEKPTWGPHVTLRDCRLPIGTVVFRVRRPTMQGDTAVATVSTYMTYKVPYVSLDALELQLERGAEAWRVTKVLMMAAS